MSLIKYQHFKNTKNVYASVIHYNFKFFFILLKNESIRVMKKTDLLYNILKITLCIN